MVKLAIVILSHSANSSPAPVPGQRNPPGADNALFICQQYVLMIFDYICCSFDKRDTINSP